MKKFFLILMISAAICLNACGTDSSDETVASGAAAYQSPVITVVSSLTSVTELDDFDASLVAEELDSYVYGLTGIHIDLQFVDSELYNQILTRYSVSGNLPDVFYISSSEMIDTLHSSGSLLILDELLENYGAELVSAVGEEVLSIHSDDKGIYAVPCLHDRATCIGVEYRVGIAEEYGLDMENVKTLEDLTEIFEILAESNSDIVACSEISINQTWDTLSDGLGVLMNYGKSTEVVNLYETAEFEDMYRLFYEWYEEGYILDTDTGMNAGNKYVRSSEIFGKLAAYHPALSYVDSVDAGEEIACVALSDSFLTTDAMTRNAFVISSQCEYPEEAMRFLNLMYTDAYVMNLLSYGVEGEHYDFVDEENGIITFPEGVDRESNSYIQFRNYCWGNQFITYTWDSYPSDIWEQVEEFNETALRSAAYCFSYDSEPVADEVEECLRIADYYLTFLEAGVGDFDTILSEFREALKNAEIDDVIAEKQRQLDDFLAEQDPS